jgi:predicted dinucleotide-binding enzyme
MAGHEVVFGSRSPSDPEVGQLKTKNANVATVKAAVEHAEVIALAIPWNALPDVIGKIKFELRGKIIIDCTNPSKQWPNMDHSSESGDEQVAKLVPEARVVKAFNTTGFENMQNPKYPEGAVSMFYAGNDGAAKKVVRGLIEDLGFDPVDAGPLAQAHALEGLASLWGALAYSQQMGRGIAFRLMKR